MMPDVSKALYGLGQPVQFSVVQKTASDFEVSQARLTVKKTIGSLQPYPERELRLLPEGQRKWKHWTYLTRDKLVLDWELCDSSGKQYRVLSSQDWASAGYNRYVLTEQPKQ